MSVLAIVRSVVEGMVVQRKSDPNWKLLDAKGLCLTEDDGGGQIEVGMSVRRSVERHLRQDRLLTVSASTFDRFRGAVQ